MSFLSSLGEALRSALAAAVKAPTRRRPASTTGPSTPTRKSPTRAPAPADGAPSPGQTGRNATVEIDPATVGAVRMAYSPSRDGTPDPGEIVWTWVPFEERDGRGKDRPVLVVAAEKGGTFLGVQLTSKSHQGDAEFVPIGSGDWDSAGRPSWVNIDRVFRLHAAGMRRESAGLPREPFAAVETRLRQRYGWR